MTAEAPTMLQHGEARKELGRMIRKRLSNCIITEFQYIYNKKQNIGWGGLLPLDVKGKGAGGYGR